MEKRQFKAESKRLMEMMIHSIYTHKEIFLREIISNASDAIDKLYFRSLSDTSIGLEKNDFFINIDIDKENRTLTISDNGIGMTKEDLENNLGTIAKSGSLSFKNDNELDEDVNIIGQFGVGFYSAFMVAKKVVVTSKAFGEDKAYTWQSEGVDGYEITESAKDAAGTEIVLYIMDNTEEENYDQYLESYQIQTLIKKYSDYIRFPIKMEVETSVPKEGSEEEFETVKEIKTINSMVPIWRKNKNELKEEDYNSFYQEKFHDYTNPLKYAHIKTEGTATYNALLFIPSKAPYNYYSKDYEKGLELFSNGVLIMDKCADLLPDYFSFVRGLVDSEDLSLNISRELLQHDRQLKIISKNIEKTIKNNLTKLQKENREQYAEFFKNFGLQLKYGIYSSFGANNELLQDLLMYKTSFGDELYSLDEYVSRMKEDQKFIYYATGNSVARIESLPQIEMLKEKGFEVLYCTDEIDEFALKMLAKYKDKEFKSTSSNDLDLETAEEKEEAKKQSEENADLFKEMKENLSNKVVEVRLSNKLKTHPVCLSNQGDISIEMEKVLNSMPNSNKVEAQKVLEVNSNHEIFKTLQDLYKNDKETLKKYTEILYTQALMIEGLSIENPVEFSNMICDVMTKK